MNITVLMASGTEDTWESANARVEMGGTLAILNDEGDLTAVYAPGMWMKFEVEHDPA